MKIKQIRKEQGEPNHRDDSTRITPGNLLQFYTLGYILRKQEPIYRQDIIVDFISFTSSTINWGVSNGTYYPLFKKIVDNGYITWAYDEKIPGRNTRKYYEITEVGKQYYKDNAYKYKDLLNTTSKFYNNIIGFLPEIKE